MIEIFKKTRLARLVRLAVGAHEIPFWQLVMLNYAKRYTKHTISFGGKPLRITDACSFIGIYRSIFIKRCFHFQCAELNPHIIDAGCNIGLATIYLSSLYPNARFTLIEPDPDVFACLKYNIESQDIKKAILVNAAISNTDGQLEFRSEGGASGRLVANGKGNRTVRAIRLSSVLNHPVEFLKMDIEGAELDVLEESQTKLMNVKRMFIEYHSFNDRPQKLSEILRILSEAGFRYQIHEDFTSRNPFKHIEDNDGMDLQLNIFAIRS